MSWLRAGPVSFAWALAGSLAGASGCGPVTAAERGAQLFQDPAFSPSPSNVFSCATCHRVADGAQRFAGPDLRGVVRRSPLWCGQYGYLLDAVNNCLGAFMRAEPLAATDDRGRALLAYLQGLPGGPACAAADVGFVRVAAGTTFPLHRHLGDEHVLVLQGTYVDSDGSHYRPGDLAFKPEGSSHEFTAGPDQDLIYVTVFHGVEVPGIDLTGVFPPHE